MQPAAAGAGRLERRAEKQQCQITGNQDGNGGHATAPPPDGQAVGPRHARRVLRAGCAWLRSRAARALARRERPAACEGCSAPILEETQDEARRI
ncbi:protein of unknown function (plasmid) [Rhodovastum atsumiense]|nr:protein of unknown function [Rhodovastum atsumiense]